MHKQHAKLVFSFDNSIEIQINDEQINQNILINLINQQVFEIDLSKNVFRSFFFKFTHDVSDFNVWNKKVINIVDKLIQHFYFLNFENRIFFIVKQRRVRHFKKFVIKTWFDFFVSLKITFSQFIVVDLKSITLLFNFVFFRNEIINLIVQHSHLIIHQFVSIESLAKFCQNMIEKIFEIEMSDDLKFFIIHVCNFLHVVYR